jgi:hypothetical protein
MATNPTGPRGLGRQCRAAEGLSTLDAIDCAGNGMSFGLRLDYF